MKSFLKHIILTFFALSVAFSAFSQAEIDSLTVRYDTYMSQGDKATAAGVLLDLYRITERTNDITSLQYAANALQLYSELGDTLHIALCNKLIGDNYFNRDILAMAMDSYSKALEIYQLSNSEREKAYVDLQIGQILAAQKLTLKAQETYQAAFDILVRIKDSVGIAEAYDLRAQVILIDEEQDDNLALALLDSALVIRVKLKDEALIAKSFEMIANAHFFLEDFETAASFLEKALQSYKKTGNIVKQADAYFGFGEKYLYDKHFEDAKHNFFKAYDIYRVSEIYDKQAKTAIKLAEVYLFLNNSEEAKKFAAESLALSFERNLNIVRQSSYKTLATLYAKTGNHRLAFDYMQKYAALTDSIRIEEQNRQTTELQINLATQKKEQEISLLQQNQKIQDAELQRNQAQKKGLYFGVALMGAMLVMALIFGYFIYRNNKRTKQINEMLVFKNQEINQQKEEILAQRDRLKDANISITKQRDEIKAKNEKIEAGMFYASKIQRAMQPKMKEIREQLPESFVMLSPKEAVSGDFYWYANIIDDAGDEKTVITAVDCTGHGVSGAFMSMLADAYLTQIVHQRRISHPEIILQELHKGIVSSLQQEKSNNADGMDMALCVIDKKRKILEFAGAKNPLFYIQNGKSDIFKGDHDSIGGIKRGEERIYTRYSLDVSVPTIFYMYSDGFQDQFGGELNKKFMAKRFRDFLEKISTEPINKQATALAVELDEWKSERQQMDDILIIGVKLDLTEHNSKKK